MAIKTITTPDIGGATDVDVIEVLVKAGDQVKVDTPIITIESDKATMEIPSPNAGTVKELKIKKGDKVSQGSVILMLEVSDADVVTEAPKEVAKKAPDDKKGSGLPRPAESLSPHASSGDAGLAMTASVENAGLATAALAHASPVVRQLAREFGIDLSKITPTGPKQRVTKEDLQLYVKTRLSQSQGGGVSGLPAAPTVDFAKFGPVETEALSRIKKLSGKNLHRNWVLIPHVTQFGEADISELEAYRQAQKATLEKQGIKLTPLIFIMKAVVAALKAFPQFNASLDATGENIILKKYFHIGVAVDTPDGLVVPVIRDVDQKGMLDLAKELSEVSEKARKKQLTANDMQGGCFSISSLGGIGGTAFTPIVNMPEVAILGVSKSSYKPVYEHGQFVPKLMLPLSLSYDHRVIDGADGARFIVYLANMLADVRNLLL